MRNKDAQQVTGGYVAIAPILSDDVKQPSSLSYNQLRELPSWPFPSDHGPAQDGLAPWERVAVRASIAAQVRHCAGPAYRQRLSRALGHGLPFKNDPVAIPYFLPHFPIDQAFFSWYAPVYE